MARVGRALAAVARVLAVRQSCPNRRVPFCLPSGCWPARRWRDGSGGGGPARLKARKKIQGDQKLARHTAQTSRVPGCWRPKEMTRVLYFGRAGLSPADRVAQRPEIGDNSYHGALG